VVHLGDKAEVEAHFVRLEIVLILMQDWWIVYAEHAKGMEIILDALDGTPR
jgi:hypothetical protein